MKNNKNNNKPYTIYGVVFNAADYLYETCQIGKKTMCECKSDKDCKEHSEVELCDHSGDEVLHQGNGFIYMTCAVVWNTLENFDASTILAQHAFVNAKRGAYYEDKYDGNKSLCGKIGAHDGDKYIDLKDFDGEELNEEKACKTCLKIYRKRHCL